ncbi:hypothetical protein GALMADRAFT_153813 [Galerina marginata CBS 339.88]|uniref:Plasma membrane fusion protein PRM1 n=1 Tax=Galerina marginata (strain CBS 339.88) TaxID=685588 RepID=A0A067TAF3_GALM3|nr:hypothetical protein GALMADRAFT_153813 [Galerina marginata CBS 339.88]
MTGRAHPMRRTLYTFCLLGLSSFTLSVTAVPSLPIAEAGNPLKLFSTIRPGLQVAASRFELFPVISSIHPSEHSRGLESLGELASLEDLIKYSAGASQNASTLTSLADSAANVGGNIQKFQRECVSSLMDFIANFQGFQEAFANVTSDNNFGSYDDELEILLKDIVNANKNALSSMDYIISDIPAIGPLLGPMVYEIEDIIDQLLDTVENLTDGLLNALGPDLQTLSGEAACIASLKIIGLCL